MGRGFTLIEILVVVVILGILAAVVVPQYANATTDAKQGATVDQVVKIRNALAVYYVRNNSRLPEIVAGTPMDGAWGQLLDGDRYLRTPPTNMTVGGVATSEIGQTVIVRDTPDTEYSDEPAYGWIFSPERRTVWAANHDEQDRPLVPGD
jgi:general secretion pathway protein G